MKEKMRPVDRNIRYMLIFAIILVCSFVADIYIKETRIMPSLENLSLGQDDVEFGGFTWTVMEVENERALLFSNNVLEKRSYDGFNAITWEDSKMREYLNAEFLQANFSEEEQKMMMDTTIKTPDNPWSGISGGNDTRDKLFLLSIQEVVDYYGDSGMMENGNPDSDVIIKDKFNENRQASGLDGERERWFLRSTGNMEESVAAVLR